MQYVIGVDAGGTTTTAAAYDYETGTALSKGKSGFGNLVIDYNDAVAHLKEEFPSSWNLSRASAA